MRSADRFYAVDASSWDFYRTHLLEEAERVGAGTQPSVLELGSGSGGYSSRALAAAGFASMGIDISPEGVRVAQERVRGEFPDVPVEYRAMNAEALDFPDQAFDIVCGTGIIHHLDLETAYGEIARVLRPGGMALFSEPMGHNPLINLYRRMTPGQRTHDEHPLRRQDIELGRAYFEDVGATFFHCAVLAAIPFRNLRLFPSVRGALDRVDRMLFDRVPPSRWLAWIVVLRLRTAGGAGDRPV